MPRKFGHAAKNARECPSGPTSSATALTPSTSARATLTSRRKKRFEKNCDPRLARTVALRYLSHRSLRESYLPGILSDCFDSQVSEKSERSNFDRCPAD